MSAPDVMDAPAVRPEIMDPLDIANAITRFLQSSHYVEGGGDERDLLVRATYALYAAYIRDPRRVGGGVPA